VKEGNYMETIKGTVNSEVAEFEIRDYEVANIIINALIDKGYDIISKPIKDNYQCAIGEQIKIYKMIQR
jgi:hypothetical protein